MQSIGNSCFLLDVTPERKERVGVYAIRHKGAIALIDCGAATTISVIERALKSKEFESDELALILLTHIHLDHAGAIGRLAKLFPNVKIGVDASGAKHLLDPSKLNRGADLVFGVEKMKATGYMEPVRDGESIFTFQDGMDINLNGRSIKAYRTYGHAYHHYSFLDSESKYFFAGDAAGISYDWLHTPAGEFLFLPSAPSQFDVPAWRETLEKIRRLNPKKIFVTHYGEAPKERMLAEMEKFLDFSEELMEKTEPAEGFEEKIRAAYENLAMNQFEVSDSGRKKLDLLENDIFISYQGPVYNIRKKKNKS